jgi:hypothetical protein
VLHFIILFQLQSLNIAALMVERKGRLSSGKIGLHAVYRHLDKSSVIKAIGVASGRTMFCPTSPAGRKVKPKEVSGPPISQER